jgi:hypothetical protein
VFNEFTKFEWEHMYSYENIMFAFMD